MPPEVTRRGRLPQNRQPPHAPARSFSKRPWHARQPRGVGGEARRGAETRPRPPLKILRGPISPAGLAAAHPRRRCPLRRCAPTTTASSQPDGLGENLRLMSNCASLLVRSLHAAIGLHSSSCAPLHLSKIISYARNGGRVRALHASLCLLALSSSDAEYNAAAAIIALACNMSATDPAATDNGIVPAAVPVSGLRI